MASTMSAILRNDEQAQRKVDCFDVITDLVLEKVDGCCKFGIQKFVIQMDRTILAELKVIHSLFSGRWG